MTTRAIGALLAALALVCWLATFAPVNLSLAQGGTEAPELEPGRYVVVGVVVYDTWSGHETILRYGWFATPTPSPVVEPPTQPPSDTPQPTPTATLTPSVTVSTTPTATNTLTYTPSPTATVQTPTDTPTGIPADVECYGEVVTTLPLNVRRDHSATATVLAKAQPGQRWRVFEVWYASDEPGADEWVQVRLGDGRTGWMAAYYGGQTWVRYDHTPDCLEVRFPGGVEPPTPVPPTPTAPPTSAPTTPAPDVTPTPDTGPVDPPPTSEYPYKVCSVRWSTAVVLRNGPGTSSARIGSIAAGSLKQVLRVERAGGYVWAQTPDGWAAIYVEGSGQWWVTGGPDGALCVDIPGWQALGLGPPPGLTAFGFTVVTGANRAELDDAGKHLQAAGIQPAATVTCDDDTARFLAERGWRVNFRPCYSLVGDLPITSLPASDSARARVDQSLYLLGTIPADVVQLTNEWQAHDPVYLRDWLLAAVAECDRRGVTCIPVMFNPGTPPLEWLETLRPAFRAMKDSGHYLGLNLYPVQGFKLATLNSFTLWTTYRYRLLAERLGADMPAVWVSEAAEGRGESPPDVVDMAQFACATYGELAALNFWYVGLPLAHWAEANLRGHLTAWAVAVAERLRSGTCGR